jgi:hypothetical protein
MKVLNFEEFSLIESRRNAYSEGDIVLIRYWETGDLTPVKIVKKVNNNNYIIDFKIAGSNFLNAPNQNIKKSDIIGVYKGNDAPAYGQDMALRKIQKISNDLVINGYPKTI